MMHPVGPHDAQTYWIRRAVVAVVAVALVAGVVWWALGRGSGSGPDTLAATTSDTTTPPLTGVLATDPATESSNESGMQFDDPAAAQLDSGDADTETAGTATSDAAAAGTTGTAATSPTDTGTTAAAKTTAAPKTTAASATTGVPDASMVETTMPAPVTVTVTKLVPATGTATKASAPKTTAPKTTAPPQPSYDAAGRLICPAASISLTGVVWGTISGQQPRLGMNATNVGKETCRFNVGGAAPVYTVTTTGGAHIWSTADCFPSDPYPVSTLAPGHKVSDVIVWSGTTSAPGCSAPRVKVKAGTYALVIQLGAFKSKPLPFTMK